MDSTAARGGAVMTEAGGGRDPGASSLSCPAPTKASAPRERGVFWGTSPFHSGRLPPASVALHSSSTSAQSMAGTCRRTGSFFHAVLSF